MIDVTKKELKEIILQAMEVVYLKHQKQINQQLGLLEKDMITQEIY